MAKKEQTDEILEEKQATAPATPTAAAPSALLMYIGPTLTKDVYLRHRSVFSGGVPASARALAEKDPELAGCFVPLAEAGKALRELEGYPGTVPGAVTRHFNSVRQRYAKGAN
jgi:hypothetical protein